MAATRRRRPAPTADEQRAAFAARLEELRRQAASIAAELELTAAALDRLEGKPLTPDTVRRTYAARRRAGAR